MANIVKLPIAATKVQKVSKPVFEIYNPFSDLLNYIKEKQIKKRRGKLNFLFQQGYQYYYDLLETPQHLGNVDLPMFIYEQQRKDKAMELAHKALLDVIAHNRVNQCYKKHCRIKKTAKEDRNEGI